MQKENWKIGTVNTTTAEIARCEGCLSNSECPIERFKKSIQNAGDSYVPNQLAQAAGLTLQDEGFRIDDNLPGKNLAYAIYDCEAGCEGAVMITLYPTTASNLT